MSVLNNREHAEHLLTAIDRMRENGRQVSSREKGYWLDLLEYRDDETGRCDPGRRELEAKTGHGHRTLAQMDARARELRIYRIERVYDKEGRPRNQYVWNGYMLDFDNGGQPTRVLANSRPRDERRMEQEPAVAGRAGDPPGEDDRGQVTSKKTSLHRKKNVLEEKDGPVLCGQLTTVSGPEDLGESSAAPPDHLGGRSAGSPGRLDSARTLELAERLGELAN